MSKIECLYNEVFFKALYEEMLERGIETILDYGDTEWHIETIEDILIDEYGWLPTLTGINKC